jgi:hypothetical protein
MSIEAGSLLLDYLWTSSKHGQTLSIFTIYQLEELFLLGIMVEGVLGILRRGWIE